MEGDKNKNKRLHQNSGMEDQEMANANYSTDDVPSQRMSKTAKRSEIKNEKIIDEDGNEISFEEDSDDIEDN